MTEVDELKTYDASRDPLGGYAITKGLQPPRELFRPVNLDHAFCRPPYATARDRDRLGTRDVLVVVEAGMIGTRRLQGVLAEAASGGARVVMVGDIQQLQEIGAGTAFACLPDAKCLVNPAGSAPRRPHRRAVSTRLGSGR